MASCYVGIPQFPFPWRSALSFLNFDYIWHYCPKQFWYMSVDKHIHRCLLSMLMETELLGQKALERRQNFISYALRVSGQVWEWNGLKTDQREKNTEPPRNVKIHRIGNTWALIYRIERMETVVGNELKYMGYQREIRVILTRSVCTESSLFSVCCSFPSGGGWMCYK